MAIQLSAGARVEVKWHRRGWLPGTVDGVEQHPDPGENFNRVRVAMDNGFACDGSGYHPDCVRLLASAARGAS